tara:strand:- start:14 stop:175 length:162 start_codon:yes stop_codon:yes gene_type:complete
MPLNHTSKELERNVYLSLEKKPTSMVHITTIRRPVDTVDPVYKYYTERYSLAP